MSPGGVPWSRSSAGSAGEAGLLPQLPDGGLERGLPGFFIPPPTGSQVPSRRCRTSSTAPPFRAKMATEKARRVTRPSGSCRGQVADPVATR